MPDYRLENAIADLDAVYVENEDDRKTLSGVNRAIERLRNSTAKYYENDINLKGNNLSCVVLEVNKSPYLKKLFQKFIPS